MPLPPVPLYYHTERVRGWNNKQLLHEIRLSLERQDCAHLLPTELAELACRATGGVLDEPLPNDIAMLLLQAVTN